MAIGNGLLNNPVLSGLLGGGGPAAIKATKDRELAQLRQGHTRQTNICTWGGSAGISRVTRNRLVCARFCPGRHCKDAKRARNQASDYG